MGIASNNDKILNETFEKTLVETGLAKWYESTIRAILINEKYKRDVLLQKNIQYISLIIKYYKIVYKL